MKTSTGSKYSFYYEENVVYEDLPSLPKTIKSRVKEAIKDRLSYSPDKAGKALLGELKGHRRIRVGDYRVVYRVDKLALMVMITGIKHREYSYED
ncbi:type II toxin-antitoxin system RelE/ParE family toxin [Wolbachia endosymbiont of Cantharis cryptica]|uniref:type II toxin-antitoxin system RelE family toxin n=1 Tax=Wolbachia endosymbiont of Cantharis cryptica TaxID=3066132 RepID=UPI00376EF0E7